MRKGKPGPVGAWIFRHPLLGLLLLPFIWFMPNHWLAVEGEESTPTQIPWPGSPMDIAPKDGRFLLAYVPDNSRTFAMIWWEDRYLCGHRDGKAEYAAGWMCDDLQIGDRMPCDPEAWWELPQITARDP